MKRVVVGLSGGVDSSVAAYLLKEQGFEVIGIFMKNWHDDSVTISDECPWIEDSYDAMMVAQKLNIPFQTIDLSADYKKRIVDYMFSEYNAGRTPNPDILCNREIKFDVFLKAALKLKADYVATGHYCRKETIVSSSGKTHRLLAGRDETKDQSYFLCQLTQDQLSYALFPIGDLQKSAVREIAKKIDLVTAEKKDSQGLCFVGKVHLPEFLQQQLAPRRGKVINIAADHEIFGDKRDHLNKADLTRSYVYDENMGTIIGEHQGAHYYTIGQRKGLNIGGFAKPLFIIGTDVNTNIIYTGMGDDHPGLFRKGLKVSSGDIHWIRPDLMLNPGENKHFTSQIRYRQKPESSTLYMEEEGMYIIFDNMQKAIAPGQFVAWYEGDELVGSGVIQ